MTDGSRFQTALYYTIINVYFVPTTSVAYKCNYCDIFDKKIRMLVEQGDLEVY